LSTHIKTIYLHCSLFSIIRKYGVQHAL
jgi:hypothetical protein